MKTIRLNHTHKNGMEKFDGAFALCTQEERINGLYGSVYANTWNGNSAYTIREYVMWVRRGVRVCVCLFVCKRLSVMRTV